MNCDPISAFGGIVACNFKLDNKTAKEIIKNYYEVVIANGFEKNSLKILSSKKNLRLIDSIKISFVDRKLVSGINSYLIQTNDNQIFDSKNYAEIFASKNPGDDSSFASTKKATLIF